MDIGGNQLVPASQAETWKALNDIGILQRCIPGCEAMEQLSDTQYQLTMRAKIGPVNAKFKGLMTLQDVNEPHGYKMVFEGQGGVAGFAKGQAAVDLVPESENSTRMSYSVKAMVGGKLAQLGARLMDGVARKLSDEFFTKFNALMSGEQERDAAGAVSGAGDDKT